MNENENNGTAIPKSENSDSFFSIELKKVPIEWDLSKGRLTFFGIDSALFWTDPSLMKMLSPLVEEVGIDLFRLLVANSSSHGTKEDYHDMVSTLGSSFQEGFLAWGEAVSTAGWGIFTMPYFDSNASKATVIVKNSWELCMQRELPSDKRWGAPFLQGKIIGIFSYAFGRQCWVDDVCHYWKNDPTVVFHVYPSQRTIPNELQQLRQSRMLKNERVLAAKVKEKTEELKLRAIERRELEKALDHAQKMETIGTLAGGIAHDFNNILMPLIGFAELMKYELPAESELVIYTDEILKAADRARNLIDQILSFSRSNMDQVMPVSVRSILKECLKLMRSSIASSIRIERDIDPNSGFVMADATKIHQIIINLITNALQSMEKDGKGVLTLSLHNRTINSPLTEELQLEPGEYLHLKVEDTGQGISKENIEKVFDPYFTTKPFGKGTGLGLSVVHGIVKNMGGAVSLESTLDIGTVFHAYLPVMQDDSRIEPDDSEESRLVGGNESILVIDDEVTVLKIYRQMLKKLGYHVMAIEGSQNGLNAFIEHWRELDLVITDLSMPELNGVEVTKKIKSINPDMQVMICTGFGEMLDKDEMRKIDVQHILFKPPSIKELAHSIRKVLDRQK